MGVCFEEAAKGFDFLFREVSLPNLHVVRWELEAYGVKAVVGWPFKVNKHPAASLTVDKLGMYNLGTVF
jgi:hypothetical protein